jgi:hypothetical protein
MGFGQIKRLCHRGNSGNREDTSVAELLDSKDVLACNERLVVNIIQIDTIYRLFIRKGYFTEDQRELSYGCLVFFRSNLSEYNLGGRGQG